MIIKENTDPKIWADFLSQSQPFNFLQSRLWGDTLEKEKRNIRYLEFWNRRRIVGVVLLEKKQMARGGFFYLESLWGPVWLKRLKPGTVNEYLREARNHLARGGDIFWRLSPPASVLISPRYLESKYYFKSDFEPNGSGQNSSWEFYPTLARTRPPKRTLVVDLLQDESDILGQMKPKTRYNIKLALKKKLNIRWSRNPKDLKEFWRLFLVTAKRGGFNPHNYRHYSAILKAKSVDLANRAELISASYREKTISVNLLLYFNGAVYYLHGASDNEGRNLMSTYLLHWEAMKRAKKEGCLFYDFWGVDPIKWPGVTRFKEGFGGKHVDYPPIYEIPLKKVYYEIYRLYRRIKN
jgi:lipid II:glycine glycyltransferase (peptidoglycan interpeptide bridge formation enzyme)